MVCKCLSEFAIKKTIKQEKTTRHILRCAMTGPPKSTKPQEVVTCSFAKRNAETTVHEESMVSKEALDDSASKADNLEGGCASGRKATMGQAGNAMHTECVGIFILYVLTGGGDQFPSKLLVALSARHTSARSHLFGPQTVADVYRKNHSNHHFFIQVPLRVSLFLFHGVLTSRLANFFYAKKPVRSAGGDVGGQSSSRFSPSSDRSGSRDLGE